jgi:hypothetical protein
MERQKAKTQTGCTVLFQRLCSAALGVALGMLELPQAGVWVPGIWKHCSHAY